MLGGDYFLVMLRLSFVVASNMEAQVLGVLTQQLWLAGLVGPWHVHLPGPD